MSLIKEAKKGVVWTFLQQFSVQGINFLVQILLARILLPSDFGLVAMLTIFIAIGQALSESGMTTSLIRNNNNTEKDYGTVFIMNIVLSTIIFSLFYLLSPLVAKFYKQEILEGLLKLYSLVFVINSFFAVQLAKFTKELNFKAQFTYQLPSVIIGAVVGITLAKLGFGVWSLVWLSIAQSLSFALILWLFSGWRPKPVFAKSVFNYHFSFGFKLSLSSLINTVYINLYKIIIGKKFSPASVGFFTQADSVRLFPVNQISAVLNKVTFPLFANVKDDDERLAMAFKKSVELVLSFSAALMFFLILIAESFFLIVFGEKWLPSVPYFKILCIASIFLPVGTYSLNILKVKGKSGMFLKAELIKKTIGIVTLILCLPYGITAIVWGLSITNVFFAYLNAYFTSLFIPYSLFNQVKDTFRIIGLAFLPFAPLSYISNFFAFQNPWFEILLLGSAYIIAYIILIFIFNPKFIKDLKLILKK